jgi:hypothetical protein
MYARMVASGAGSMMISGSNVCKSVGGEPLWGACLTNGDIPIGGRCGGVGNLPEGGACIQGHLPC